MAMRWRHTQTAAPGTTGASGFADAEGHALTVEQLGVVSGHTYQVTFAVAQSTDNVPGAKVALGRDQALFSNNGKYSIDVVATQDGRLVFVPQQADAMYDGAIGQVSVREITSDPAPATSTSNQ